MEMRGGELFIFRIVYKNAEMGKFIPTNENKIRFFKNECPPEEHDEIINWLHQISKEKRMQFLEEHQKFLEGQSPELNQKTDINFNTVKRKLKMPKKKHRSSMFYYLSRIAAVIVFMVSGYFMTKYITYSTVLEKTLQANNGNQINVELNDGTCVKLNSGSTLNFPKRFKDSIRMVSLEGQAFFDVAHNPQKPFIIKTSQFKVRVLGTAFDIRAFNEDEKVSVKVLRGKVKIDMNQSEKTFLLTKNKELLFNKQSGKIEISDIDAPTSIAWINELFFSTIRRCMMYLGN